MLNIDKAISSIDTLLHSFGFYSRPMTTYELAEQEKEKITPLVAEKKLIREVQPLVRDMEDEFMARIVRHIKNGAKLSNIEPNVSDLRDALEENLLELLSTSGFTAEDDAMAVKWAKSKAGLYAGKIAQDMKLRIVGGLLDWYIKSKPRTQRLAEMQEDLAYEFADSYNYAGFGSDDTLLKVNKAEIPGASDVESPFLKAMRNALREAELLQAGKHNVAEDVIIGKTSGMPEREGWLWDFFTKKQDAAGIVMVDNAFRNRLTGSLYVKAAEQNIENMKAVTEDLFKVPEGLNYYFPGVDDKGHAVLKSVPYQGEFREASRKEFTLEAYEKQVKAPIVAAESLIQDSPSFYVSAVIHPEYRGFRGNVDELFKSQEDVDRIIAFAKGKDPLLARKLDTGGRGQVESLFKTILSDRSKKLNEADKLLTQVRDFVGRGTVRQAFINTADIAEKELFDYKMLKRLYDKEVADLTIPIFNSGTGKFEDVSVTELYKRRIIERVQDGGTVSKLETDLVGVANNEQLRADIAKLKADMVKMNEINKSLGLLRDERILREQAEIEKEAAKRAKSVVTSPVNVANNYMKAKYVAEGKIDIYISNLDLQEFIDKTDKTRREYTQAIKTAETFLYVTNNNAAIGDIRVQEAAYADELDRLRSDPIRAKYEKYVRGSGEPGYVGWVRKDDTHLAKLNRRYYLYDVSAEQAMELRRDALSKEITTLKLKLNDGYMSQELNRLVQEKVKLDSEIGTRRAQGWSEASIKEDLKRSADLQKKMNIIDKDLTPEGKAAITKEIANLTAETSDKSLERYVKDNPPHSLRAVVDQSQREIMSGPPGLRSAYRDNIFAGNKLFAYHHYKTYGTLATIRADDFIPKAAVDVGDNVAATIARMTDLEASIASNRNNLKLFINPLVRSLVSRGTELEAEIAAAVKTAEKSWDDLNKEKRALEKKLAPVEAKISEFTTKIKAIEQRGIDEIRAGVSDSVSGKTPAILAREKDALTTEYEAVAKEYNALNDEYKEVKAEYDSLFRGEVFDNYDQLNIAKDGVKMKYQRNLADLTRAVREAKKKLAVREKQYENALAKFEKYEEGIRVLMQQAEAEAQDNLTKTEAVLAQKPFDKEARRIKKDLNEYILSLRRQDTKNPVLGANPDYFKKKASVDAINDEIGQLEDLINSEEAKKLEFAQLRDKTLTQLDANFAAYHQSGGIRAKASILHDKLEKLKDESDLLKFEIGERERFLGAGAAARMTPEEAALIDEYKEGITKLQDSMIAKKDQIAAINKDMADLRQAIDAGDDVVDNSLRLNKLKKEALEGREQLKYLREAREKVTRDLISAEEALSKLERYGNVHNAGGWFSPFVQGTGYFNEAEAKEAFTGTSKTSGAARRFLDDYASKLDVAFSYGDEAGFSRSFSNMGDAAQRLFNKRAYMEKLRGKDIQEMRKTKGINPVFKEKGTFAKSFDTLLKEHYINEGEMSAFENKAQSLWLTGCSLIEEGIANTEQAVKRAVTTFNAKPKNIPINVRDVKFEAYMKGMKVPGVPGWVAEAQKLRGQGVTGSGILEGTVQNSGAKGAIIDDVMRSGTRRVLSDLIDTIKDWSQRDLGRVGRGLGWGALGAIGLTGLAVIWESWKHPRDREGKFTHVYKSK